MFDNIGRKLKAVASVTAWMGIIASVIFGIVLLMNGVVVIGDKEMKLALIEKWKNLESYKMHPSIGKHATLLATGRPYIMNSKLLILEYQFAHDAEKVNFIANQKPLASMVKLISDIDIKIYAICRNESYEASRKFMELRQLSKLPRVTLDDIEIDIKGE